ncbi:MAG TPA: nucleotide exchange factor GrpE [Microbacteriaceae bacterium]|nr:nucleotide exchange factor GrpE [Microbacteriaceae bacterium]
MADDIVNPDHTGDVGGPDDERQAAAEQAAAKADREGLSEADRAILDEAAAEAEVDLVAEYRDRAARAEAELVNFRARVERDRQVNRDATVADVLRSVLPAFDDLDRAEANGDVPEGSALELVVQKLRAGFERYGLQRVGVVGEPFDPNVHEALMQLEVDGVEGQVIHEVVQPGYLIGERVVRAAKVAVAVPKPE